MSWGTRHDNGVAEGNAWDLTEGFLNHDVALNPALNPEAAGEKDLPFHRHGPSGEPDDDDGAGNMSPRVFDEGAYGSDDGEASEMPDDWHKVGSDEARF